MLQALEGGRPADLLEAAARMERNSINHYRAFATNMSERDVVLAVLEEELRHLRSLERLASRQRSV